LISQGDWLNDRNNYAKESSEMAGLV
jgi:hypothetical protein